MTLSHLKTSQLMALYNLALPAGATRVNKFSTRPVAEKRTAILLTTPGIDADSIIKAAMQSSVLSPADAEKIIYIDVRAQAVQTTLEAIEPELGAPKGLELVGAGLAAYPLRVGNPPVKKATKLAPVEKPVKAPTEKKKQVTAPQLNLRCQSCGYFAKTTQEMMKKARLVCPVDAKHGKLLTAEERGENRGR